MSKADVECLTSEGLTWRCSVCAVERRRSLRMETRLLDGNYSLEDLMKEIKEIKEEQRQSINGFNHSYEILNEKLSENTELQY